MIHIERFIGYLSKDITISDSVILLTYFLMSFYGNAYTSWRAFLLLAFSSFLLSNEYNIFVILTELKNEKAIEDSYGHMCRATWMHLREKNMLACMKEKGYEWDQE